MTARNLGAIKRRRDSVSHSRAARKFKWTTSMKYTSFDTVDSIGNLTFAISCFTALAYWICAEVLMELGPVGANVYGFHCALKCIQNGQTLQVLLNAYWKRRCNRRPSLFHTKRPLNGTVFPWSPARWLDSGQRRVHTPLKCLKPATWPPKALCELL